jgi:hypothetical protein
MSNVVTSYVIKLFATNRLELHPDKSNILKFIANNFSQQELNIGCN